MSQEGSEPIKSAKLQTLASVRAAYDTEAFNNGIIVQTSSVNSNNRTKSSYKK